MQLAKKEFASLFSGLLALKAVDAAAFSWALDPAVTVSFPTFSGGQNVGSMGD